MIQQFFYYADEARTLLPVPGIVRESGPELTEKYIFLFFYARLWYNHFQLLIPVFREFGERDDFRYLNN